MLVLLGRREERGSGLRVCLNREDEKKGLERALYRLLQKRSLPVA